MDSNVKKKARIQKSPFFLVEESLFKWIIAAKSANIPISFYILREKALFLYNKIKEEDIQIRNNFEASDGWIRNFLERYNLSSKNIHGESESVDKKLIEEKNFLSLFCQNITQMISIMQTKLVFIFD